MDAILTIDFEASCLPRHGRSFPIEVGICDNVGYTRSWLIRPHAAWHDWDWTAEAENLHGLSRDDLWRVGLPADVVLFELTQAARGQVVVADSHLDSYWLDTLVAAAEAPSPFEIRHVSELIDRIAPSPEEWATSFAELERLAIPRHRAGGDAQWLTTLIRLLHNAKAARPVWGSPADTLWSPARMPAPAAFAHQRGLQPALQQ